ncbi:MAG: M48 family metalloprotease [Gammaproteobacteria bacterium]|jgi:predicted Zn-dependent protease
MRAGLRPLAMLAFAVALWGCQSNPSRPGEAATVQPGYQPALDSDEAGLWLTMDKSEQDLRTSGKLITDPRANAYVQDVVCRLADDMCRDMRVYLVRIPHFNASMAPNGVMQVWSGLLLRAQNEAQLAYILGHEIAHYRYQHSLQMFRQTKTAANILAPFQVVTAAGGVGYVGSLAQLAAVGTLMKFSRDHERQADSGGLSMMIAAGYDPDEAPRVWEGLEEEKAAEDEDEQSIFLSTHPLSDERIETLKRNARIAVEPEAGWYKGAQRYDDAIAPLRSELLRDELRLRRFNASQVLLHRLAADGASAAEIRFFQAELYSARAEEGDRAKAEDAYRECLAYPDAPPQAYRELATIYMKSGRETQAVPLFETYLVKRPDAFDRGMVKAYIQRIESGEI